MEPSILNGASAEGHPPQTPQTPQTPHSQSTPHSTRTSNWEEKSFLPDEVLKEATAPLEDSVAVLLDAKRIGALVVTLKVMAGFFVALGVGLLMGWVDAPAYLLRLVQGEFPMRAGAAFGFMLLGGALFLLTTAWFLLMGEAQKRLIVCEMLRFSESRFRLTVDAAEVGCWEMDLATHRIRTSGKLDEIFGYSTPPAWTYERLLEHIHPSDRPRIAASFSASMEAHGDWAEECRIVKKNGAAGWIRTRGRAFAGTFGQPLKELGFSGGTVIGLIGEITDRKMLAEVLAWEMQALELTLSSISLGDLLRSFTLGLEKVVPDAFCSILLLDADGVHLRHGAAPNLPEAFNRAVDGLSIGAMVGSCGTAAFTKERVIVSDIEHDPRWEKFRDIASAHGLKACWSAPILGRWGKVLGTFAIYYQHPRSPTDLELDLITRAAHIASLALERDAASESIWALNVTLEERVLERTQKLELAMKELDAFSYSVSHDLRAPLRAVSGFSRLLEEESAKALSEEGQRMLRAIRSEAQRMSQLIDDLLAFSRIGRVSLEPEKIDMVALVRSVFDELSLGEPLRKLHLDLQPLPPALGTPALIRQVWLNLLGNAIKFTREREVAEITVSSMMGEDGVPVYVVRDNGVGFDMRYAGKLFTVFQRLHNDDQFEGTGVGLSLVHRILERHGGRIWAEAEVNRGATFYFTIPDPKKL